MKIIPLINEITNTFNKLFEKNLNPLNSFDKDPLLIPKNW